MMLGANALGWAFLGQGYAGPEPESDDVLEGVLAVLTPLTVTVANFGS